MPLEGVDQGDGGLGEEQEEEIEVHLEIFSLPGMKITNHGRDLEEGGDKDEVGKEGGRPCLLPLAEGHLGED